MRYIKEYAYANDVQDALDNGELGKPYVAYIEWGMNSIDWNTKSPTPPKPDYSKMLFSIVAHSDGIIYYKTTNKSWQRYLFSTATSSEIEPTVAGFPIEVSSGDVVGFYGYSTDAFYKDENNYCYFDSTAQISLQGNILSVHNYYDDPENVPVFFPEGIHDNYFKNLFKGCTNLISAENLFLPYDTAIGCYSNMFEGCTSLTKAPDLLATTSIKSNCYSGMFKGCSSLNYIKCMAESDKGAGYTTSWVDGVVASDGTFVKASGVDWPSGTSGIPSGWTVIEE